MHPSNRKRTPRLEGVHKLVAANREIQRLDDSHSTCVMPPVLSCVHESAGQIAFWVLPCEHIICASCFYSAPVISRTSTQRTCPVDECTDPFRYTESHRWGDEAGESTSLATGVNQEVGQPGRRDKGKGRAREKGKGKGRKRGGSGQNSCAQASFSQASSSQASSSQASSSRASSSRASSSRASSSQASSSQAGSSRASSSRASSSQAGSSQASSSRASSSQASSSQASTSSSSSTSTPQPSPRQSISSSQPTHSSSQPTSPDNSEGGNEDEAPSTPPSGSRKRRLSEDTLGPPAKKSGTSSGPRHPYSARLRLPSSSQTKDEEYERVYGCLDDEEEEESEEEECVQFGSSSPARPGSEK